MHLQDRLPIFFLDRHLKRLTLCLPGAHQLGASAQTTYFEYAMSLQITAVSFLYPPTNRSIARVRWALPTGETDESTVAQIIEWLKEPNARAFVHGAPDVEVTVVNANPPYLRTVANGRETDNLLRLPRF